MMSNPFFAFIGGLFAPLATWLDNRGKLKQAELNRDLAVINNQARLAQSTVDNNHQWEMESIRDKDKFLRLFSYCMFTAPIIITVVWPSHGAIIFKNLEDVPPWLVQTWVAINGGVWGIASLKNIVPQFVGQFRRAKNG